MPASSSTSVTDLLFVYGTLRRGAQNEYAAYLHAGSTFVGVGHMPGKLYHINWFPGAIYIQHAITYVTGDVFRLHRPAEMLTFLDDYEDTAADGTGIFIRQALPIAVLGQTSPAWVYLYNCSTDNLVLIESGDYAPYL